jgi:aspartate/tyrosine/aromatic aminotransferase
MYPYCTSAKYERLFEKKGLKFWNVAYFKGAYKNHQMNLIISTLAEWSTQHILIYFIVSETESILNTFIFCRCTVRVHE